MTPFTFLDNMDSIVEIKPIGIIHTPYIEARDIPIQGRFKKEVEGWVELKMEFEPGLNSLDEFSHAFLIYYFHWSKREDLLATPYLEDKQHGIFSIRSPHRPNHIGFTVVKILRIEGKCLYFSNVDMLDGTPLLDIKPYVKHFDMQSDVVSGWVDKHFEGDVPERVIHDE